MDKARFEQKKLKALQAHAINWSQGIHLDARYSLDTNDLATVTPTGLLLLFVLFPKNEELPWFKARWDEDDDSVDVDIGGVDARVKKLFYRGATRHKGHHSRRIPGDSRSFLIDIALPGLTVCNGTLSFSLLRGISLGGTLGFSGGLVAKV